MVHCRYALPLLLAALAAIPASAATTPIAIADFVRHPTYSAVKLSPTGDYLAITVDRGEQDVLTVLRTADLSVMKINQLPDEKSVGDFHWVSADRLMFTAVRKMGGYAQPFMTGEWFAVNADGSQPRPLIFYGVRDTTQRSKTVTNERFALIDTLEDDDQYVLMQATSPRSSEGAGAELVKLDVLTGRRISLGRAPKENCSIVPDERKTAKFAVCRSSRNEEGDYEDRTGIKVGYKPAGGISKAKDALLYLALMKDELGDDSLYPDLFRFGASSLLGDIERQLEHHLTGHYSASHRHAMG